MSNEQTFLDFIAMWEHGLGPSTAALRDLFADDCVWVQPGMPTTTGPEEAIALVDGWAAMGMTAMRVTIRSSASSPDGNTVFTERIDEAIAADGSVIMTIPVTGVTEFRDGKISAWREYFDTAALAPPS